MLTRPARGLLALALLTPLVACAAPAARDGVAPGTPTTTVRVLAAASLAQVLEDLAPELAARGVVLQVSTGGSTALARRVLAGEPADLLLTAGRDAAAVALDGGAVAGAPVPFARNRLSLVVPRGNPGGVDALDDLADPDLVVALCAPEVPCGSLARSVLRRAGIAARPDTLDRDVVAVLTRVRLGEVDAALVYRTDALAAAGQVAVVPDDRVATEATDYDALVLRGARAAAREVVALLSGPVGQQALQLRGFERG